MGKTTFKYAFNKRDFAEVELQINRGFANTVVRYHESEIGTIPTRAELAEGASYELSNGARLRISLPKG